MSKKLLVKGKGHGLGYNTYPCEFELNVGDSDSDDYIERKARIFLKQRTACDCVTLESIEVISSDSED